jgi:hypothetical protein
MKNIALNYRDGKAAGITTRDEKHLSFFKYRETVKCDPMESTAWRHSLHAFTVFL